MGKNLPQDGEKPTSGWEKTLLFFNFPPQCNRFPRGLLINIWEFPFLNAFYFL